MKKRHVLRLGNVSRRTKGSGAIGTEGLLRVKNP